MSVYEDEIDIRPYLQAIIRHWWKVLLSALFLGAVTLLSTYLKPPTYKATATILITRSRPVLSIAQEFPTITEETDRRSRLDAIVAITKSDSIVFETYQSLNGDYLSSQNQNWEILKKQVEVENKGDAIFITASAHDPDLAAQIANTWALHATEAINTAYSGVQSITLIQQQLHSTLKDYNTAQVNLEEFIRNNQIEILQAKIQELKTIFSQISEDRTWPITFYTDRKQAMETLIAQSEALKNQLESGSASTAAELGDALAVLKARAEAAGVGTTLRFDIQLTDLQSLQKGDAGYVSDLEAIIVMATQERDQAESILKELATNPDQSEDEELINQLAARIRELETQLEQEKNRKQELMNERDIARQAYQALREKETELKSASQTSDTVTLASQAVTPQKPVSRGVLFNTLAAGGIGILLGVSYVFATEWWRESSGEAPTP